jgi:hypothetical protein
VVAGRSNTGQGPPLYRERASRVAEERIGGRADTDELAEIETASRYEPLDVPPLLPFWLGCLLAGFVAGVLIWISFGYPLARQQESRGPMKSLPAPPRLETAPMEDLRRYREAKVQELKGSEGTTPIQAAMRQTARQGWGPPK